MDNIKLVLFNAMRRDIGVMAEHDDDEKSLWQEILNADDDILTEYMNIFL